MPWLVVRGEKGSTVAGFVSDEQAIAQGKGNSYRVEDKEGLRRLQWRIHAVLH